MVSGISLRTDMKINKQTREVTIPEEDFNMMLFCMLELNALKKFGVKDWKYYEEALESIQTKDDGEF